MSVPLKSVSCCIAGGGPAGMVAGLLLARAGVDVLVLEKHADFLRDFRGDTIHPSTLQIMHELDLLQELLTVPHQKVTEIRAQFGDETLPVADFSHLPVKAPFIAMMPQWDFLNFLASRAKRYPGFQLQMQAEAKEFIETGGRISGLRAATLAGPLEISAELVIAADGRHSVLRDQSGVSVDVFGAPMDVLWFRLSRKTSDPDETLGKFEPGAILIRINRGTHWQCAIVIAKGSLAHVQRQGLDVFRQRVGGLLPFAADRLTEISSWDDVKLLTVAVDRMRTWYRPGVLFIGDAAHAMSPIGGVGINLAIQDAVAAASILALPLRQKRVSVDDLRRVQQRRQWPTNGTQKLQMLVQNRVISQLLADRQEGPPLKPPLIVQALARFPLLRRVPGRLLGLGLRSEHVAPAGV